MRFEDARDEYIERSPSWKNLAPSSRFSYSQAFDDLAPFDKKELNDIKRPDVVLFFDALYDKPGISKRALSAMNNVFKYSYDRGYTEHIPTTRISNLKKGGTIPRWTPGEVELVIASAIPTIRAAVMMAYYTGQRLSDLVKIKWEDYNGYTIKVVQKKTGKKLTIPVHPRLKEEIDKRKADIAKKPTAIKEILVNRYGHPWMPNSLQKALLLELKRIGVSNRSIHGLRKSTASSLAEAGATMHQIRAITGQSLKEVERYTREADQEALAKEAIGGLK